jgi:PAS domain-containing protein
MSDPAVQAIEPDRLADLRSRAASRLTGAAATKGSTAGAADALTVLHALASSPDTASDALTLLHELQVHQVELDLQAQELHESRSELESALRRQIELYDFQPVGCFTIDPRLVLLELNQTGADMLGTGREDLYGLPLDAFLCAESARRFRSAISSIDAGLRRASCRLTLRPKAGPECPVLASIGQAPAANRYLVSLANT